MPILIKIIKELDISIIKHVGNINDDEFFQRYTTLFSDSNFFSVSKRLVDLRETNSLPRSSMALKYMSRLAHLQSLKNVVTNHVAIVAKKGLSFGLAREFEAYSKIEKSLDDIQVFESMTEAAKWLDVDPVLLESAFPDEMRDAS